MKGSIRHLIVLFCLLVILPGLAYSQKPARQPLKTTLFDEYGQLGGCDHSARLDNLAIRLMDNSSLDGHILYYGPREPGEGTLAAIKDYLVNSRGIEESRLTATYGGVNDNLRDPRIQLWLVPRGSLPPIPKKYQNDSATFTGMFEEMERWDDGPTWGAINEGSGPSILGASTFTFLEMLSARKDTVAYLVGFNGKKSAPGAWRRIAQLEAEDLQTLGLEPNRIKILFGGTRREPTLQFWLLPAKAGAPIKDVATEQSPTTRIQLGTYDDFQLTDEKSERWGLLSLVDVLQTHTDLRACIIVRQEQPSQKETGDPTTGANEHDYEPITMDVQITEARPADVLKVAEKWKTELAQIHKIPHARIVVLFANAREGNSSSMETWLIPPGVALPDPDAEDEEAIDLDADTEDGTPAESTKQKAEPRKPMLD